MPDPHPLTQQAVQASRAEVDLSWPRLLARLLDGDDLSAGEARWAMREVALGNAEPAQLAGFLVALRSKGESPQELRGLLDALMEDVVPVRLDGHGVLGLVGTGGDGAHTVNVSTMAAVAAAASGPTVLKHGGRSASSRAGAADVLEVLGLPLDLRADSVAECVRVVGIGFTFASRFVPGSWPAPASATCWPTACSDVARRSTPAPGRRRCGPGSTGLADSPSAKVKIGKTCHSGRGSVVS